MDAASYARQLKKLLPPGKLWHLEQDSEITSTLLALSEELARVDARGDDIVDEADPRTAEETIELWEQMLGLPNDLITEIPATLAERRVAITQQFVSRGGQNEEFFILLAAACGYTVTITRHAEQLLRSGFECPGYVKGEDWAYAFTVTVSATSGDALTQAEFERVIRHATHDHVQVVFA